MSKVTITPLRQQTGVYGTVRAHQPIEADVELAKNLVKTGKWVNGLTDKAKAQRDAIAKRLTDEAAKREAEAKAQADAEEAAKREAEAKAQADAEEAAKREAEAKAQADEAAKAKAASEKKPAK